MGQLAAALVADCDLRCGQRVRQCLRRGSRLELRVEMVARGEAYLERVDGLIVATTASDALALCADLGVDAVSSPLRDYLASQRYGATLHAAYLVDEPIEGDWHTAVPLGEGAREVAMIRRGGVLDGGEIVSVIVSHVTAKRLDARSAEAVDDYVWRLAQRALPTLPDRAVPYLHVRIDEAAALFEPGRFRVLAELLRTPTRSPVQLAGSYLASPTLEGALRSGERASRYWR